MKTLTIPLRTSLLIVWFTLPVMHPRLRADPGVRLSIDEAFQGWLLLFDGESIFGWDDSANAEVKDGALVIATKDRPINLTSRGVFGPGVLRWRYRLAAGHEAFIDWHGRHRLTPTGNDISSHSHRSTDADAAPVTITVPAHTVVHILHLAIRPDYRVSLFDGQSLSGWRRYQGDPKREKSEFTISPEGYLHVRGGPGDLQTTEQFADFLLHVEARTNGDGLNSGIFFRALPHQYQQGYEAQIHHRYLANDRHRPADFGTGGIYRRKPARKVVSNDREWFTLTVQAHGNRLLTWVNGYPTCDFEDDRSPHENPRSGKKTSAGVISIQGHEPTTDLDFRKILLCPLHSSH
jgi:hypothetical protein